MICELCGKTHSDEEKFSVARCYAGCGRTICRGCLRAMAIETGTMTEEQADKAEAEYRRDKPREYIEDWDTAIAFFFLRSDATGFVCPECHEEERLAERIGVEVSA